MDKSGARKYLNAYAGSANEASEMKVSIFKVPKAGTYFIVYLNSVVGFGSAGFHASGGNGFISLQFDLGFRAKTSSQLLQKAKSLPGPSEVKCIKIEFRHLSMLLMSWMLPEFHFISSFRHPRSKPLVTGSKTKTIEVDIVWKSTTSKRRKAVHKPQFKINTVLNN